MLHFGSVGKIGKAARLRTERFCGFESHPGYLNVFEYHAYNRQMKYFEKSMRLAKEKGYFIDNSGLVWSPKGRQLKCGKGLGGYIRFSIADGNGRALSVYVHRLVAYQKFGDIVFEKGVVTRHLDGNLVNNFFENIAVGSMSDNMMDRPRKERLLHAKKAASHRRKLSKSEVSNLRAERANGATYRQLCQKYGIAKSTVSYIVNAVTYR